MSGFSADWLALREPFDRQARGDAWPALAPALASWRAGLPHEAPLAVLDLACGTGSSLRALAPRLGGRQRWRLVDHDASLLAALPHAMERWAAAEGYAFHKPASDEATWTIAGTGFHAEFGCERTDLAQDLATLGFDGTQLVTASALLDLVSAPWLEALVQQAAPAGCGLLFALSVDGRTVWTPADAQDEAVHSWFLAHQRRDKGFGPALGPDAVPQAMQLLQATGYACCVAPSDWAIGAGEALQSAMVDGMADAALEQAGTEGDSSAKKSIAAWRSRRLASVAANTLTVGHLDLLALPEPCVQPISRGA